MEGTRQGNDKAFFNSKEDSISKLAQKMYYQLLDEHNELLRKTKKEIKPKIKIKLVLG